MVVRLRRGLARRGGFRLGAFLARDGVLGVLVALLRRLRRRLRVMLGGLSMRFGLMRGVVSLSRRLRGAVCLLIGDVKGFGDALGGHVFSRSRSVSEVTE